MLSHASAMWCYVQNQIPWCLEMLILTPDGPCTHMVFACVICADLYMKFADHRSVIDEIGDGAEEVDLGGRSVPMRAYASWFNFKGADQQKSVGVLSGGERNRLQLAKVNCALV